MLETARLTLRKPVPTDIPGFTAFFLDDRARYVGGGIEWDAGRAWRAFASILGHWEIHGFGIFTLHHKAENRPIGACGPWFPALWPEREIGWSIWSKDIEGNGYMAEAADAVLAHVFDDLGWETAVSYIDPANERSIALAKRLGAVLDEAAKKPDAEDLVYRHTRTAR